jgi:uncharacterized circularly permuted ATP-grasp superfamily protein
MAPTETTSPSYDEGLAAPIADALDGADLAALADAVEGNLADGRVVFGRRATPFRVDPIPRVLTAAECEPLAAGLCQRTRALDRFVADIYHAQTIIREGVIPASVVAGAAYFEPLMQQACHQERRFITVAGLD